MVSNMHVIHRFWDGPALPEHAFTARAIESTQGQRPHDWTPDELPHVPLADPRHASNLARYELLYEHGGLWLDHDVLPLRCLARPYPYTAGVGSQRVGCAMWFPKPGHPLLAELLEAGSLAGPGSAPERSGGRLLNRVAPRYPDVRIERGLLGFDATGHRVDQAMPQLAVHLWTSSHAARLEATS